MSETEIKIALVGSAPASVRLAPYHDPSWRIWGCSPGVYGIAPRTDAWFELHRFEPGQPWFSPEYCQWLAKHPLVYMAEQRPEVPNSRVLPVEELTAKYSSYFFTSSLAWMMAMAIEAGATKIGLWGVDMAASEEYGDQRSGLHYFALIAAARGIEVGIPPESDLFTPRPLYGVSEIDHAQIKVLARKRELQQREADATARAEAAKLESWFLKGAIENQEYNAKTWMHTDQHLTVPVLPELLYADKFGQPDPIVPRDPRFDQDQAIASQHSNWDAEIMNMSINYDIRGQDR